MEFTLISLSEIIDTDLEGGTLIIHKGFSHADVEYEIILKYPDAKLIPVTPGTDAYTLYGTECSYLIQVENPT